MSRPRLLDLFCGAGGAARGYQEAGFYVVGVDIEDQPNYCGDEFFQMDALEWQDFGEFELIHASPPCQAYSTQGRSSRWGTPPSSPPLIAETQVLLDASGVPFVIENVAGARVDLRDPMIAIRGPDVGLTSIDRLRYFELGGWWVMSPFQARHDRADLILGVYGRAPDGRQLSAGVPKDRLRAPTSTEEAAEAMGIDWMKEWREVAEAIPPAYTKWIGERFLEQVRV